MITLPGGRFTMGSERFSEDESPLRSMEVEPFALDTHPVTNEQFAAFVAATGYVTTAERPLSEIEYADFTPEERVPGGLVFHQTAGPNSEATWHDWWRWVPGAQWRHPFGPTSSILDKAQHPVVQVTFEDASRYAEWAGKRLPTESEWEYAARGGLEQATYAWGDELRPGGVLMANTWQGLFPWRNNGANGWEGTSPIGCFAPNGFGFLDLIGNVWEWTVTPYLGSVATAEGTPLRVLKGGSHLCSPEHCIGYRPAARSPQADDTSTTHIGFRCARDVT